MSKQINKTAAATKKTTTKKVATISFIEKNALKIAILLAIFGLILRLYRIGFLSLWVDEYMHALAAINGKFKHGENNGILLTWLNTIFAFILGKNEFSMRFPVALLGAALIPTVYVLGKQIANYRVGLMAAALTCLSLYLIYWSRVDRPYGMVAAFYVPLLVSFWMMLESPNKGNSFLAKIGIQPKYLGLLLVALLLSMLSQLICFLFLFTAGFYGTLAAIDSWVTKKSKPWQLNAYNLLFFLNIAAVFLMLTPLGNKIMRPIIELFLPPNIATLILPDMKAVMTAFKGETWTKSFDVYLGVIQTDFKLIPLLGLLGIVFAFFQNRKTAYFLFSAFAVPLLLMSFIFREPVHAKYLSFVYPVFLISAAYALYYIGFVLLKKLNYGFNENNKNYVMACTLLFVVISIGATKRNEISEMLKTQKHGNVVPREISEIHYVNWKQPCLFIRDNQQKGDVLMATVKDAPRFYLRTDSVAWFRQMHYDAAQKTYVPNLPDNRPISAYTYEQLVKTIENNQRGWILADYYFDNALTDPRAKQYVEQNLVYHFDACEDGAVKVFSWDKSKPKTYSSAFVIELGKNPNQMASAPLSININKAMMPPKVQFYFTAQGIDSNNEAYVFFNENGSKAVAIKTNGNSSQIGYYVAEIETSQFVNGENKIQFAYNEQEGNGDINKGFVVYNLEMR